MRRIIEISVAQDQSIGRLVEDGRFQDVQHFVSSAIQNQLLLEEVDSGSPLPSSGINGVRPIDTLSPKGASPRPLELALSSIRTTPALKPDQLEGGSDPNRWLWGQVNSVLGIKFACREVAHILGAGSKPLKELAPEVAAKAAVFGDQLRDIDRAENRGRGQALSTSFPTTNPARREKSIDRFSYHYVGYRRMDGRYDGALFHLGLLSVGEEGMPCLTEAGAAFAAMRNPAIDREGTPAWLSEEEENFYLREVAACQAVERRPISWMLETVGAGADSRGSINKRLAAAYEDWSEAEVETFRVGTLSRMVQLRVLSVERNGRDFRYKMGPNSEAASETVGAATKATSRR